MIKNIKSMVVGSLAALLLGLSASAYAGFTITAPGSFDSGSTGFGARVDQTFTAAATGSVSFDWTSFATYEGPGIFNAGYLLGNGVGGFSETTLSSDFLANALGGDQGSSTFSIAAGQTYGFYVYSVFFDTANGSGIGSLTINNLSVPQGDPNNIPEPGSIALLGLGLLGVVAIQRRKPR
jgi:PEP-CTERM motif